jgi:hypothetical protein
MDRLALINALRIASVACVCAAMPWPVNAGKLTGEPAASPSGHSGTSLERLAAAPGTLRIGEFDIVTGSGSGALPMTPRVEPAKAAPVRTAQEPRRSANTTAAMLPDAGCATLGPSASSKPRSARPESSVGCW